MIALQVVLLAFLGVDDPIQVLHRTAEVYEGLGSFEIHASLSFKVPNQDIVVTTRETAYYASSSMLPVDAPVPVLNLGRVGGGATTFRNSAGQEVAGLHEFHIASFSFNTLDVVDKLVASARALGEEVLMVGDRPIKCAVIEAVYDKRSEFGRGRPIRLWIDTRTWLVQQAKYMGEWHQGELTEWTAHVEKMTFNEPTPQSVIDAVSRRPGLTVVQTKWTGLPAPNFTLETLDGETVTLAGLRGKVVLLDFWATWCGPCREEMRLLEKLREELKPQGVEIWGVTDEKPEDAGRWLADHKRALSTLIDVRHELFQHFAIESVPVLIALRRDGTISSVIVGMRGERDLRADIAKATQ